MKIIQLITLITFIMLINSQYLLKAQCTDAKNIETFQHNEKSYEIVKDKKTWEQAADCAVERGGVLVEINDFKEQKAIFDALMIADIEFVQTSAPDGGNGAYVWIGGNDISIEGNWIWDGDGDNEGSQFWMGEADGTAIDDQYTNWGNEPDDYNMQDALGLSLNGWPLGKAGQWNDISRPNKLYFVIEYDYLLSNDSFSNNYQTIQLYPNPLKEQLTIESGFNNLGQLILLNAFGKVIHVIELNRADTQTVYLGNLNSGIYIVQLTSVDGQTIKYEKVFK